MNRSNLRSNIRDNCRSSLREDTEGAIIRVEVKQRDGTPVIQRDGKQVYLTTR